MDIKTMAKCISSDYANGYNSVVKDINEVIDKWKKEIETKDLDDDYKQGIIDAIESINEE